MDAFIAFNSIFLICSVVAFCLSYLLLKVFKKNIIFTFYDYLLIFTPGLFYFILDCLFDISKSLNILLEVLYLGILVGILFFIAQILKIIWPFKIIFITKIIYFCSLAASIILYFIFPSLPE